MQEASLVRKQSACGGRDPEAAGSNRSMCGCSSKRQISARVTLWLSLPGGATVGLSIRPTIRYLRTYVFQNTSVVYACASVPMNLRAQHHLTPCSCTRDKTCLGRDPFASKPQEHESARETRRKRETFEVAQLFGGIVGAIQVLLFRRKNRCVSAQAQTRSSTEGGVRPHCSEHRNVERGCPAGTEGAWGKAGHRDHEHLVTSRPANFA